MTKPDRNMKNDKLTKTVDPYPVFIIYMNGIDFFFFLQISFTYQFFEKFHSWPQNKGKMKTLT